MRILVTGGSGFVGKWALHALSNSGDNEVHALSRKVRSPDQLAVWHQVNLLDPSQTTLAIQKIRPEIILHLAWDVEHSKYWSSQTNLSWSTSTLHLAKEAVANGVKRFVATGTCFEYDWPSRHNCNEMKTPLRGHTLYDISKDACRRILEEYLKNAGVEFSWARLFFLFGLGEAPGRLVSSVSTALGKGEMAPSSSGRVFRDYMDVRDAGAALAKLTLSNYVGAINVASGRGVLVADIVRMLGEISGRPDLIAIGALPDREGEPGRIVADVKLLKDVLDFSPAYTLKHGLADTLNSFKFPERNL